MHPPKIEKKNFDYLSICALLRNFAQIGVLGQNRESFCPIFIFLSNFDLHMCRQHCVKILTHLIDFQENFGISK